MPYLPADSTLQQRRTSQQDPTHLAALYPAGPQAPKPRPRYLRNILLSLLLLAVAAFTLALYGRHWVRAAVTNSLPQLDGTERIPGLTAPVTVLRDAHGVPSLTAQSQDDLLLAQGFVTAQDRLFQMDTLRRHAAGELAEVLGPKLLPATTDSSAPCKSAPPPTVRSPSSPPTNFTSLSSMPAA